MLESVYAGLTGLSTFSKGLNNISSNIANLNTPGFKRTQVSFTDLLYNQQNAGGNGSNRDMQSGNGVEVGATSIVFSQGELRQTGNDQDVAIQGNGFFILNKDGETFYTRAGQFEFDADGYLVSRNNGARVAVLNAANQPQDFNGLEHRINPPKVTGLIKLDGNISVNDSDDLHEISGINVVTSSGEVTPLSITFTDNTAVTTRSWKFQIEDQAGNVIANGEVRFQGDGSPQPGFDTFSFVYTAPGSLPQTLTFDFGAPGKFSGLTNFSAGTDSTAKLLSADGYAIGSLNKVTYDEDGRIVLSYSNGQTSRLNKLALAWFDFLPGLEQAGGGLFVNDTDQQPIIGAAKTSVFGKTTGGSIEASNVDLTQQFSELIVTQRGYQASSQVVSAANEMMQQLLDLKGRR